MTTELNSKQIRVLEWIRDGCPAGVMQGEGDKDRLPQLLWELETQAREEEERRIARQREAAERQRQWEEAMRQAERRLIEDHQRRILSARVDAWHGADAIRAYCDAVEQKFGAAVNAANVEC